MSDRIEAATFLAALGVAGGEIILRGAQPDHMAIAVPQAGRDGGANLVGLRGDVGHEQGALAVGRRVHLALSGACPPTASRC